MDGEDEVVCVVNGAELGEALGELGEEADVVLEAMGSDLSVGLGEVREGRGDFEEVGDGVLVYYASDGCLGG